jgi:glucosamine-6-phosphate deaminase
MIVEWTENTAELARRAARLGAAEIRAAIKARNAAYIILATGASQLETLEHLIAEPDIDWSKVGVFHLDEYIAMPVTHKASFRRYLNTRFVQKVPQLAFMEMIEGDAADPGAEIARISAAISAVTIDVAFIGIGENAHLAFNDPPADFDTKDPFLIVDLDEKCRRQQLGEGWFPSLADVPAQAISMSVREILRARTLICAVPDARKAEAVRCAIEGPVSNLCPSSILQTHDRAFVFIEPGSAAALSAKTLDRAKSAAAP